MERVARCAHVARERDHLPPELTVAPQAERVAVGIDEVGERLELLPLRLVVPIREPPWIGAFPGSLDLDETDKCVLDGDSVIGPRFEIGQRRLAYGDDGAFIEVKKRGKVRDERFERAAELVFGLPVSYRVGKLRCRGGPEAGHGGCEVEVTHHEVAEVRVDSYYRSPPYRCADAQHGTTACGIKLHPFSDISQNKGP